MIAPLTQEPQCVCTESAHFFCIQCAHALMIICHTTEIWLLIEKSAVRSVFRLERSNLFRRHQNERSIFCSAPEERRPTEKSAGAGQKVNDAHFYLGQTKSFRQ
jgi:hypothetical protein